MTEGKKVEEVVEPTTQEEVVTPAETTPVEVAPEEETKA